MLDELLDASGCLGSILEGCLSKVVFLISPFVLAIVLGLVWKSYFVGIGAFAFAGIAMIWAVANDRNSSWAEFTAGALDVLLVLAMIPRLV